MAPESPTERCSSEATVWSSLPHRARRVAAAHKESVGRGETARGILGAQLEGVDGAGDAYGLVFHDLIGPSWAFNEATSVASWGLLPWKVARYWAVPNPKLAGAGLSAATAEATMVAPTATMTRARMRSCWRHSLTEQPPPPEDHGQTGGTTAVVGESVR